MGDGVVVGGWAEKSFGALARGRFKLEGTEPNPDNTKRGLYPDRNILRRVERFLVTLVGKIILKTVLDRKLCHIQA